MAMSFFVRFGLALGAAWSKRGNQQAFNEAV
jgi:hypothetical protein